MMSNITIIGEPLLATDPNGKLKSRTATVFPHSGSIVTLPIIHAFQIDAFVDSLNRQRAAAGLPQMNQEEERAVRDDAVAVTIGGDADTVHIRSDPENMPLASKADRLLQKLKLVSKRQIKLVNVLNAKVREAVKRRGECWRIAALPTSPAEMKERISAARIGIQGKEIYYYNSTTGTRLLTCHEFSRLGGSDESQLRQHLGEIREFSARLNPQHNPEIAFFMADNSFRSEAFAPYDFGALDGLRLQTAYEDLRRRFHDAVEPGFREDNLDDDVWRNRMFSALIAETDDVVQEDVLLALSPEFHMQIRWLPGGRIVNGELLFDEVFEEEHGKPDDPQPTTSGDNNAREFLYNLVRSYEDLEYVNIGQVVNSLSRRPERRGRREVYIAVIKRHSHSQEDVSIIRMQKWGVREHLNDGLPPTSLSANAMIFRTKCSSMMATKWCSRMLRGCPPRSSWPTRRAPSSTTSSPCKLPQRRMPIRSTAASTICRTRRNSRAHTWTPLSTSSCVSRKNITAGERHSTPSSATAITARTAVSPIAGNRSCNASTRPTRANWWS